VLIRSIRLSAGNEIPLVNELHNVLNAVIPVVLIAIAGGVVRRINWLSEEADQSLLRVVVNLLTPCLILDNMLGNEALRQPLNVLLPPLVGFGTIAAGTWIAGLFARPAGLSDAVKARTFAAVNGTYNYGFVPIPLALSLFDRETAGVLFVFNVGVEVALWTVSLFTMQGNGGRVEWRKLMNPPLVAIVIALGLNFTHAGEHLPQFLNVSFEMLGQCAIPMAILLIGATMVDRMHEFHAHYGVRVIAVSSLVRLGVLPMLFLLLAKFLPCSVELKRVILLQAAMPAAVFPIVMAKVYGGDTATAMRVVLGTSIVGLVTMPLWIRFGMKFLGL